LLEPDRGVGDAPLRRGRPAGAQPGGRAPGRRGPGGAGPCLRRWLAVLLDLAGGGRQAVKLDGTLIAGLSDVGQRVRDLEDLGYDGAVSVETSHDPFLPLLLASEHSRRLELITGVAIAFARNPMSMAYVANDIQAHSQGRLRLGLGSQVRPHIERRFSMPWSHPAPRMREYITAMRAIWRCWAT